MSLKYLLLPILISQIFSSSLKTIYITGHKNPDTDTIVSSLVLADLEKQQKNPNKIYPCRLGPLNKETKYALDFFGFPEPMLINTVSNADEVILVDHNSFAQSASDIQNAKIAKIIDHHGFSDFKYAEPIYIHTESIGSTATILYKMFKLFNLKISRQIAGLLLSAIISDTVLLRNSVTTETDKEAAKNLAEIANVDINKYGIDLLKAGTDISDLTDREVITLDSKEYTSNGYKYQISVVNSVRIQDVLDRKSGLLKEMQAYAEEKGEVLFLLEILDLINLDSPCLVFGRKINVFERAFNVTVKDNYAFLKGISSRKKELFPMLEREFLKEPKPEGFNIEKNMRKLYNKNSLFLKLRKE